MASRSLRVRLIRSSEKAVRRSILSYFPSDIKLHAHKIHLWILGLIDPTKIERIFVSPRQRAQITFELLFNKHRSEIAECSTGGQVVQTTEDVREWDYGEFEGLKPKEILKLQPGWKIWSDG